MTSSPFFGGGASESLLKKHDYVKSVALEVVLGCMRTSSTGILLSEMDKPVLESRRKLLSERFLEDVHEGGLPH